MSFIQEIQNRIKYKSPILLWNEDSLISWLEMVYKNYRIDCKIFINIIMWNVLLIENQVLCKKIQPNPFFIIKKPTLNFQNL